MDRQIDRPKLIVFCRLCRNVPANLKVQTSRRDFQVKRLEETSLFFMIILGPKAKPPSLHARMVYPLSFSKLILANWCHKCSTESPKLLPVGLPNPSPFCYAPSVVFAHTHTHGAKGSLATSFPSPSQGEQLHRFYVKSSKMQAEGHGPW